MGRRREKNNEEEEDKNKKKIGYSLESTVYIDERYHHCA